LRSSLHYQGMEIGCDDVTGEALMVYEQESDCN
jgi:hypothetical protein